MMRIRSGLTVIAIVGALCSAVTGEEIRWKRIKLDDVFRSEGVAAGDINKDGLMDVAAGDVWYEAPDWTVRPFRKVGEYKFDGGYSESFSNEVIDVNGDGWLDIVIVGFPGKPFNWYENPQGDYDGHWKAHEIWHSGCNESPQFRDLYGNGKPVLLVGSQPESQLGFLPLPASDNATEKWDFHAVGKPGDPGKNGSHMFYHGLGVGDVNNDGRNDVMIPHGWWEAPENREQLPWEFHEWSLSVDGKGDSLPAANMYAYDFDLDGDNDIVMSSPHAHGIWWFENVGGNDDPQYKYHLIDDSYSQTHALELADVNDDGHLDLITGKRFYAHNGHDPGGKDPVVMYWYEVQRKPNTPPKFIPHEIKAGRDTGIGTQFTVKDFNGDGTLDIILGNKKGVNVLLQERGK
ncbi:VCBS repeat-containing protein [Symmachiella dynata]|uniref:FG-GAP repeat domain-containing protein n=1 Tax=Symmachiella dynata TaxID=2527995 RepID=UPI0030EB682B